VCAKKSPRYTVSQAQPYCTKRVHAHTTFLTNQPTTDSHALLSTTTTTTYTNIFVRTQGATLPFTAHNTATTNISDSSCSILTRSRLLNKILSASKLGVQCRLRRSPEPSRDVNVTDQCLPMLVVVTQLSKCGIKPGEPSSPSRKKCARDVAQHLALLMSPN
jgi:hypothetical protein